jgi:hypothetical protein
MAVLTFGFSFFYWSFLPLLGLATADVGGGLLFCAIMLFWSQNINS